MAFDCRLLGKRTSKDSVERHTNINAEVNYTPVRMAA